MYRLGLSRDTLSYVNTALVHMRLVFTYRNSGNFCVIYFRVFNFHCNLLFVVSRGRKYVLQRKCIEIKFPSF